MSEDVTATTANCSGITFIVDDVEPPKNRRVEDKMHLLLRREIRSNISSCSDYHSSVIANDRYQSLLAAVHTAYCLHHPLVLTPDAVWITISQGVAHHMAIHAEQLRSRFVSHQGQLKLSLQCVDWVEGSPENPWSEAFEGWAALIRDHVGTRIYDTLVCDFGTSGPVERTASQIVMMDVFERYFEYELRGICGIPRITLEGTPHDWDRLVEKARGLGIFDLDWWLPHLIPLCEQFARASRGDIDLAHWKEICKIRKEYGGNIINGWIAKLFPYIREFVGGGCTQRNAIFETGEGFSTLVAPSGLSQVPFTWRNPQSGRVRKMEAIGGMFGVAQDWDSLALRPVVGWAVRVNDSPAALLERVSEHHKTFEPTYDDDGNKLHLPADLRQFYRHTDGVELCCERTGEVLRIVPWKELERLDWGQVSVTEGMELMPLGQLWYRLAWLSDGSFLAINTCPDSNRYHLEYCRLNPHLSRFQDTCAICHSSTAAQGRPGSNPVVALRFTDLLERMVDGNGELYWLAADFVPCGDAEEFTRRA